MATFGQFDKIGPFTAAIGGGWKLYHYVAGTTTDKDLWSDRGKTTTVAQPLVADANGVVSFFADGLYKFVIKNSADVTQYTWDNVFYGSIESTNHAEGAALASASTLVLGSDGDYFHVTGTTQINSFSGTQPFVILTFDSAVTLTHGPSLILKGGVNHPTIAGETLIFANDGTNVFREVDNGVPMKFTDNTWTGANTFSAATTFSGAVAMSSTASAQTPTIPAQIATKAFVEKRAVDSTVLSNGYVDASVSSNVLTLSLMTQSGATPTTDDVVSVAFRGASATTTVTNVRTVSAACTLTVSAGSTLGFTTSQISRLYVVALDNSGTVELGVYHPLSGTTHVPLDESSFYSSTAEGGSGGADSAQVIYSTTARSSVPIAVLGFVDIQTGATAGNWSNSPIQIQAITQSTPKSGQCIQRLVVPTTALTSGATTTPVDDSIPQNTEGVQMFSQAITPKHSADLLFLAHVGTYSASAAGSIVVALFQDSTANALAATIGTINGNDEFATIPLMYQMQAGTASSTTFKLRAGHQSGTVYMNGRGSTTARVMGGVCGSAFAVMEVFL